MLVIDILYRRKDGSKARFRRDAQVQTMTAARAEQQRLLKNIVLYGEPFEPQTTSEGVGGTKEAENAGEGFTFNDAVESFRRGRAITEIKPRTLVGYEGVFSLRLIPRFGTRALASIEFQDVVALDAEMVEEGLSVGTWRNTQVAFRSVLSAAHETGKLKAMPKLPKLPRLPVTAQAG